MSYLDEARQVAKIETVVELDGCGQELSADGAMQADGRLEDEGTEAPNVRGKGAQVAANYRAVDLATDAVHARGFPKIEFRTVAWGSQISGTQML